jgi:UDP:flavonoid glycosyltransferase YjiC (YdhE family)
MSTASVLIRLEAVTAEPLLVYEKGLQVLIERRGGSVETLAGVQRPRSYTSYAMTQYAYAPALPPGPGARCPLGVVTPQNKTAAWWAMDWMHRESFFLPRYDAQERLVAKGHALAAAAGIPYVVLNPTINVVPAPGVPPFGLGLMPATDEAGRRRDEELGAVMLAAWDAGLPALNAARAEQGLEPLEHALDQGRTAARVLVMTSRAFDFFGPLPPTVVHVGPRLDDVSWAGEWEAPPGEEPLVLVGLSSDYQDQGDLLRRIAAALGSLPVRAVLTTGNGIDPASIEAPANVQVVKAAPHSAVLREAALAVTHGGHGVTIKSLAAGVPLVCLPMGRDQNDNAARIVARGLGLRLRPSARPSKIREAVRCVLTEDHFRDRVRELSVVIRKDADADRAVHELENLRRMSSFEVQPLTVSPAGSDPLTQTVARA